MCIAIALTATRLGATVANHTEVLELIKGQNAEGKETVTGAKVRDRLTGSYQKLRNKTVSFSR
jgi:glycerol-3-phosphate dehydrogenase